MFLPHENDCQSLKAGGARPGYVGVEIGVANQLLKNLHFLYGQQEVITGLEYMQVHTDLGENVTPVE